MQIANTTVQRLSWLQGSSVIEGRLLVFPVIPLLLLAAALSCRNERPQEPRRPSSAISHPTPPSSPLQGPSLSALYRQAAQAVVRIHPSGQKNEDTSWEEVGFFVTERRRVLTAADSVSTAQPVTLIFQSVDGSSQSVQASVLRRDLVLNLALLEPVQPVGPTRFLPLDLEEMPQPGQRVAILPTIWAWDESLKKRYLVSGILPGTVCAILRHGLVATDVYAFTWLNGSPVLDLSTGHVIGIGMAYSWDIKPLEYEKALQIRERSSTASVPTVRLVYNYCTFRSLASAKQFLSTP